MEEKFINIEKRKEIKYLYKKNFGKPKLLFLHGVTARSEYFEDLFGYFSDNYEIFAPDFAGHGKSYRKNINERYYLKEYIKDIYNFHKKLIKEKCYIIGYSMGGRVALGLSIEHRDIPVKMVIIDVGPDIDKDGLEMLLKANENTPEYFNNLKELKNFLWLYRGIGEGEYLDKQLKHYWKEDSRGRWYHVYDKRVWDVPIDDIMAECDYLNEGIPFIKTPILVIRGGDSVILNQNDAGKFLNKLQNGKLEVIKNTTHAVPIEAKEKVAKLINGFFKK